MMVMVSPDDPVPAKVGVLSPVLLSVLLPPVSVPAVRSGAAGAAGAVVSMVTASAGLGALVLPAVSTRPVVMLCAPSVSGVTGVRIVLPLSSVVAVAGTATPSTYSTGVVPAGTTPTLKSGVLSPVLLSVLLPPLSVPAVRSGAAGADGAVVSIVTASAALGALVLPAASTRPVVMLCAPSVSGVTGVRIVLPLPSVVAVAGTATPSTYSTGVVPAGTTPTLKSGVVSTVPLSVLLLPLSVAAVMSGAAGADGAVVSMVTASAGLGALVLPAVSTRPVVMLWAPSVSGVTGVRIVLPLPSVVVVAGTATPSTYSTGVVPAGTTPTLKSGVLSPVLLSVLLLPVSVVRSGAAGADGAVVSMVTASAGLGALVLPAASVTVVVI